MAARKVSTETRLRRELKEAIAVAVAAQERADRLQSEIYRKNGDIANGETRAKDLERRTDRLQAEVDHLRDQVNYYKGWVDSSRGVVADEPAFDVYEYTALPRIP
jgi:chromosome segregation ATPase